MARKPAAELARRTMEIVGAGRYEVGGRTIWIQEDVERAVGETVEYPPGREIRWARGEERPTRVEATGESSLEAARRLVSEGARPWSAPGEPAPRRWRRRSRRPWRSGWSGC